VNQLDRINACSVPPLVTASGGCAKTRLLEFLTANIRDPYIRGIEANLGSHSHFTPGRRTRSAHAKRSESPRW
jgi:hypothetical protein